MFDLGMQGRILNRRQILQIRFIPQKDENYQTDRPIPIIRSKMLVLKLLLYTERDAEVKRNVVKVMTVFKSCANHGIAVESEYHGNALEMDISVQGFRMLRPLV